MPTPREQLAALLPLSAPITAEDMDLLMARLDVSRPRIYQMLRELGARLVWVRPEDLSE